MIQTFLKKNWEIFAAIAIFIIISLTYFHPAVKGFSLKTGDIKGFKGASKEIRDYEKLTGKQTLWTSTSFSGMPAYQISMRYVNPLTTIDKTVRKILPFPVSLLFIAFLSFFILAKSFNAGFYISLIGAIAYGLSTYNFLILEAGHNTKMAAIAFIPGSIGGLVMLYRREKWLLPLFILTLFLSFELMANHIQMTYYFSLVIITIGIVELIKHFKEKRFKSFFFKTGLALIAVIISMLANFGNYYNTYQFSKKTMRGDPVISITPEKKEKQINNQNQSSGLDRDYIVQWCYGKEETWNLLFPTAKGDRTVIEKQFDKLKSDPNTYNFVAQNYQQSRGKLFGSYWGNQPFVGGPNYIGAICIFFALLYLIFVQSSLKWGLLLVSILTILLSWGKNLGGSIDAMWLTNFFIDYIPLYSKFRAVSSILVVINLVVPLMAILFLTHLSNNLDWAKKNFKNISITGGVIIVILIGVSQSDIIGFSSDFEQAKINELQTTYQQNPEGINPIKAFIEVEKVRQDIFLSDAWRSILFIVVAFALMLLHLKNEKLNKYTLGGIALLILIDLWGINTRYLGNEKNPNNKRNYINWEKRTSFSNTFNATSGDLAIYQIESSKNPKIEQEKSKFLTQLNKKEQRNKKGQESAMFAALNFNTNYRVLDLDNPFNSARASYFHKTTGGYSAAKLKRYQDIIDFYISKELSFLNSREFDKMKVLNMLNNKYYLYQGQLFAQNINAYGNCWFVNNINWVDSNNDEILAIENTNVRNTAIIHKEFENKIKSIGSIDSNATIQMTNYLPMHMSYESNSSEDGLAVFSEVYYEDGWNAYIDGKKVDYARTNYILRALNIPKGKHIIDFKFEPKIYHMGNMVNIIGSVLILTLLIGVVISEVKKK